MFSTFRAKMILFLGVTLLFVSTLFPPWVVFTVGKTGSTELPLGFSFLFTTPEPQAAGVHMKVDFVRLVLDWIILLCWVVFSLLGEHRNQEAEDDSE